MSDTVSQVKIALDLDKKGFDSGLRQAENSIGSFGSKVGKGIGTAAKVAGVALAAAGAAAVAFGVSSVKAYNDSVEASTKLRTNLMAVKGNTLENVDSLQKLASQLQKVGVIEDDAIVAGMSQLATFNLQGKTIEKLTPKIADMVAQLKGHNATAEDMMQINNLVGKVMTGNIGALGRYGVTLSETQKKQLENGNEAQRAAILVEVLGQNYGKVNEALRNTPQGAITGLKNEFGDFKEGIGEFLTEALSPMLIGFNNWLQSMGGVDGIFQRILPYMLAFWDALSKGWEWLIRTRDAIVDFFTKTQAGIFIVEFFRTLITWVSNAFKSLWQVVVQNKDMFIALGKLLGVIAVILGGAVLAAIWLVVKALEMLIRFAGWCWQQWKNLLNMFSLTGAIIAYGVQSGINWVRTLWNNISNFVNMIIGKFNSLRGAIANAFSPLRNVGGSVSGFFRKLGIPGFANGVQNFSGGFALVGERGPELVELPKGSNVYPHGTSPTTNATFTGNIYLQDKSAVDEFFTRLSRNQELAQRGLATI